MADANGATWLFGATSLIGFAMARQANHDVVPFANPFNRAAACRGWPGVDVADEAALRTLVTNRPAPSLVVYAHAVCTVSKCEAHPEWAHQVNVSPMATLLGLLPAATRFVYISSDHVFGEDGRYDEAATPRPISVYGRTRLEAEQCVRQRPDSLVIRPGLAVGPSVDGRSGHRDWLARRHRKGLPISIIADEARSAVGADALATRLWALARSEQNGLRHVPADRTLARPELARRLMRAMDLPPRFKLATRADQPHPHLGRITLVSGYDDALAQPLPSVMEQPSAVT